MTVRATPTLTHCSACGIRMAAVRGPFSRSIGRPNPPQGYRLGYIREEAHGIRPICRECLDILIHTAA